MNIVSISQIIGITVFVMLITLKLYILADKERFLRSGRTAMFWTVLYFYFLCVLRILGFFNVATIDQLRVASGLSLILPFIIILFSIFRNK